MKIKRFFRISCRFSVLANFFSVIAQILFVIAQQSLKKIFVIVVLGNQHPKKIDCWVKASWLFLCRVLPAKPEPPQWPPNGVRQPSSYEDYRAGRTPQMGLSQTQRVPCNAKLATNKQAKCEYEYVITYKHRGRSLQKNCSYEKRPKSIQKSTY